MQKNVLSCAKLVFILMFKDTYMSKCAFFTVYDNCLVQRLLLIKSFFKIALRLTSLSCLVVLDEEPPMVKSHQVIADWNAIIS